jgi:hypothetical protein
MANNFNILDRPGAQLNAMSVTANTTVTIPAGWMIQSIVVNNTTSNAVTGGVRVGTTDGGVDVVIALAVGANALLAVLDATILKRVFSLTVDTVLYIQTVTVWNSASLNIYFVLQKVTP